MVAPLSSPGLDPLVPRRKIAQHLWPQMRLVALDLVTEIAISLSIGQWPIPLLERKSQSRHASSVKLPFVLCN